MFKKDVTAWRQWQRLCSWLHITPDLEGIEDPIPFIQIFSEPISSGILSVQVNPIKKRSFNQYLCSIGQIFASVGTDNPRHNRMVNIDFFQGRQLASY